MRTAEARYCPPSGLLIALTSLNLVRTIDVGRIPALHAGLGWKGGTEPTCSSICSNLRVDPIEALRTD
jgi:hypothetical protein